MNKPIEMTEAHWNALQRMMELSFGQFNMLIDGYEVCFQQGIHKKRIVTEVFVNGEWRGKWCECEAGKPVHEEARRFMRLVTRSLHSRNDIEAYRKIFGKRKAEIRASARYYHASPIWNSFRSLKAHLVKNNQRFEFVESTMIIEELDHV